MKKLGCSNFSKFGIKALHLFSGGGLHRPYLPIFWYSTSSSTSLSKEGNPCFSFSNYLVNSLGFSRKQSVSISVKLTKQCRLGRSQTLRDINLVDIDNAVTVVDFFKQNGFQDSHIRKLVRHLPKILLSKVDTTLKPKIKLLLDLGFSGSELVLAVVRYPLILNYKLGPAIHAFKTVVGSDENVVSILKRPSWMNFSRAADWLVPNVQLLQNSYGIPCEKIHKFMLRDPRLFLLSTDIFREKLIRIEQKLGIPRDSSMFLYGLQLVCLKEKTIENKSRIFRSFGWTQSDVTTLIRRNPMCLTSAEAKIRERLDFLMNHLGYSPNYLSFQPALFICSFEKRLVPRHRVLQVLKEKQLIRENYSLVTAVSFNEPNFCKKFVRPFEEVHQLYGQLTGSAVGSLSADDKKAR